MIKIDKIIKRTIKELNDEDLNEIAKEMVLLKEEPEKAEIWNKMKKKYKIEDKSLVDHTASSLLRLIAQEMAARKKPSY